MVLSLFSLPVSSLGNTVLHVLVLQPNRMTACHAMDLIMAQDAKMQRSVPLDMVPNMQGLSPLKLAAKEGNIVVREAGWEGSKELHFSCSHCCLWSFSGISTPGQ